MKKTFIYSIILLTTGLFSTKVEAQTTVYVGEVRIIQNRFEQKGDSLFIDLTIDMNGLTVGNNQAFILTPMIEKGIEVEELPSVIVNGKRRSKAYQRSLLFNHGQESFPTYAAITANNRTRERVNYKVTIPYRTWMQNAALSLHEFFYDGTDQRLASVNVLAKMLKQDGTRKEGIRIVEPVFSPGTETTTTPPVVKETTPKVVKEYAESNVRIVANTNTNTNVKREETRAAVKESARNSYYKEGSAYLDFPVNGTRIMPDYKNNRQELAKIRAMIDEITSNPDYEVTGIHLTGYASPEGTYAQNEKLSRGRTLELRDYMLGKFQFHKEMYHVDWVAEDWTGLTQLITKYGVPDQDRVLYIINSVGIFEGREKQLMDLKNGVPYRYMMKEFFPQLRRVDYKITYKMK